MAANPPWMAIPPWTRDDDKRFELAFLRYNGDLVLIAQHLKTPLAVVKYYHDALLHDLDLIESGKYALPDYPEDDYVSDTEAGQFKYKDNERKRGIPWSQEEHGECDGLDKFGKGDWKSIARRCVKSRTATQVASHAQKYFLRRNSDAKTRKRSSIHDIITMGDDDNVTVPGSNLQPQFGDQIPPDYYQS